MQLAKDEGTCIYNKRKIEKRSITPVFWAPTLKKQHFVNMKLFCLLKALSLWDSSKRVDLFLFYLLRFRLIEGPGLR